MSDTETTENDSADAEPAALPGDGLREGIVDDLRSRIGESLIDSHITPNDDLWVRVATDAWAETGAALKAAGFTYFCFLSAIDWMPSPYGKGEEVPGEDDDDEDDEPAELAPGVTGGETRIQVFARLVDLDRHVGVTIKADVPDETPVVASWTNSFAGANWHERECHEMFGIGFDGHPDLRNLYLPGDFEGFPLRKDFPLLARMVKPWPGIVDVEPMPERVEEHQEDVQEKLEEQAEEASDEEVEPEAEAPDVEAEGSDAETEASDSDQSEDEPEADEGSASDESDGGSSRSEAEASPDQEDGEAEASPDPDDGEAEASPDQEDGSR